MKLKKVESDVYITAEELLVSWLQESFCISKFKLSGQVKVSLSYPA